MSRNTLASAVAAARSGERPAERRAQAPIAPAARPSYGEALQVAILRSVKSAEDVAARRMLLGVPGFVDRKGFAR